jgi:hypothetical protein
VPRLSPRASGRQAEASSENLLPRLAARAGKMEIGPSCEIAWRWQAPHLLESQRMGVGVTPMGRRLG